MSLLLSAISECSDKININELFNLPFQDDILKNTFNPDVMSTDELFESLRTYSYLNIDSSMILRELSWRIGEREELFNKIYVKTNNEKYTIRKDIDKIIYNELRCLYRGEHIKEELNVRFGRINTQNAALVGNMRLLEWMMDKDRILTDGRTFDINSTTAYNAAENNHIHILKWIEQEYPEYIDNNIVNYAAKNGHYDIVRYYAEKGYWTYKLYVYCASDNNIRMMDWLNEMENKQNMLQLYKYDYIREAMNEGAKMGHQEVLEWGMKNGFRLNQEILNIVLRHSGKGKRYFDILKWLCSNGLYLDEIAFNEAIIGGDINIIKWMTQRTHDYVNYNGLINRALIHGHNEIALYLADNNAFIDSTTVMYLTKIKDLELFKTIYEKRSPNKSDLILIEAAKNNNFEVLKWLMENTEYDDVNMTHYLIEPSKRNILKWALENGQEYSSQMINKIVDQGDIDMLKWLIDSRRNEFIKNLDNNTLVYASSHNTPQHFMIIKWLINEGGVINKKCCAAAAKSGNFELLKWLKENNCSWNRDTTIEASEIGRFDIVKWARLRGCLWNNRITINAVKYKDYDFLEWAINNGCGMHPEITCMLMREREFDRLKWVISRGCKWSVCFGPHAVDNGEYAIIKWALENGYENNNLIARYMNKYSEFEEYKVKRTKICRL